MARAHPRDGRVPPPHPREAEAAEAAAAAAEEEEEETAEEDWACCESQRRAWFMSIELKATPTHAIRMLRCVLIISLQPRTRTTHATASSGPVLLALPLATTSLCSTSVSAPESQMPRRPAPP